MRGGGKAESKSEENLETNTLACAGESSSCQAVHKYVVGGCSECRAAVQNKAVRVSSSRKL